MTRHAVDPSRGDVVTPEEFVARHGAQWRDRGVRPPRCPACGEDLHPYGVHSPNVTSSFHHPDESSCILSSTPDPRFRDLRPSEWDVRAGRRLRHEFCADENLKEGYAACRALCRMRLRASEFIRFCEAGDRINIWAYKGMTLELLPYVLVTLADLPVDEGVNRNFSFRLVLEKPRRSGVDALWVSPEECRIVPVFADSGRPMRVAPFSVPDPRVEEARRDTDWISDALLARLRECCLKRRNRRHD